MAVFETLRRRMVLEQLQQRDITDQRVLEAMGQVERELFVPVGSRDHAYDDGPLPIGYNQTISQPYIVASMIQLLEPGPESRILEIGTGSGYQTAVLSRLVGQVFTIEIIPELYQRASALFARLGTANVRVRLGDGSVGWPEEQPFDGIVVSAATPTVPAALLDQLSETGKLAIPFCLPDGHQELRLYRNSPEGMTFHTIYDVRFVIMQGAVMDEAT